MGRPCGYELKHISVAVSVDKFEHEIMYDDSRHMKWPRIQQLIPGYLRVDDGTTKPIILQRVKININSSKDLGRISNIFKNEKKFCHPNLIKPIGLTIINEIGLSSFYLILAQVLN